MTQKGIALVFPSNHPDEQQIVLNVLNELGMQMALPNDPSLQNGDLRVVIIDRPAALAAKICNNLRKQETFSKTTMLALLDRTDPEVTAQLSALSVDFSVKPVGAKALTRYLGKRVGESATAVTDRLVQPPPDDSVRGSATTVIESSGSAAAVQLATAQPAPQLEDMIPNCDHLLPRVTGPLTLVKGGIRCIACQKWQVRREDAFCARCGTAMTRLDVLADKMTFEPFGSHRVGQNFGIQNEGQNPLWMCFKVLANKELERRFCLHTNLATLDGGRGGFLQVIFDARDLDLTSQYEAALEIASNDTSRGNQRIRLIVERLAIPRVTLPPRFTYVLGVENKWEFTIANDGGGALIVTRVSLDGAELEQTAPVIVRGNQTTLARVRVPAMDWAAGLHTAELTCEFERSESKKLSVTIEAVRPARLTTQPAEIEFGVVSTRRERRLPLTLINSGGEELVIEAFESEAQWLECLAGVPVRIAPGGASIADVRVRSKDALTGDQSAQLAVRSNSYDTRLMNVICAANFVAPEDYEEYIGIDFGTTASCVAVLDKDGRPKVIALDADIPGGSPTVKIMPSVLYFHPDGQVSAGREAQEQAMIQPANAVTSIKRVLGSSQQHELAGRQYNATQLTARVIEELVRRTEDGLFELGEYKSPRRAIVTVPIEFYDNQRRALLEACKQTGLEMGTQSKHGVVIDEAQAAALYYLHRTGGAAREDGPELLLIFDFGGGTLDCALIELEINHELGKTRFKTLAGHGDPRLGGEDIDWAIARLLAKRAREEFPEFDANCVSEQDIITRKYRRPEIAEAAHLTRARFKRQAEAAKIALSEATAAEVAVSPLLRVDPSPLQPYLVNGSGTVRFETSFSRSDLEGVLEPFLLRASRVIETLCHRAGRAPSEVNTVLHVGRTSYLPLVSERINALLPGAEDRSELVEPKLCVALGAAFWGHIKDRPSADFEFEGVANRTVHDIGYLDLVNIKEVFRDVFPAQTEFPCEKTIELRRAGDWIDLRLAENRGKEESVADNPEIALIGRVRIDVRGIKAERVPVRFAIDENRVVEITANGQTQRIEFGEE